MNNQYLWNMLPGSIYLFSLLFVSAATSSVWHYDFFFNFEQVTYLIWKSSFLNPNIRVKRFDWLSWIKLKHFWTWSHSIIMFISSVFNILQKLLHSTQRIKKRILTCEELRIKIFNRSSGWLEMQSLKSQAVLLVLIFLYHILHKNAKIELFLVVCIYSFDTSHKCKNLSVQKNHGISFFSHTFLFLIFSTFRIFPFQKQRNTC